MEGGGAFGWEPGEWTDDTSMAIAIAEVAASGADLREEESLDALARTADAEAVRLDQREAPQRAMAQQKKAAEDARLSLEETRATNNAAFRP